jgi:hypothetical protein
MATIKAYMLYMCVLPTDPFERYPTYRFGLMDDEPKPFTDN